MTDQRDRRREQGERRDLAAMLHPLTRALVAAELPVLARHGIVAGQLRVEQANLEDAFVALTGDRPRAGQDQGEL